jgi:hypothetical protein
MGNLEILQRYINKCRETSDIHEHLPVLRAYADKCETVAEFGVRWVVSTWAFLASSAKRVYSYDIDRHWAVDGCVEICKAENRPWEFLQGDTLKITLPEDVDLLFLDTLHDYEQVKGELAAHAHRVQKYLILHDVFTFKTVGSTVGCEGIGRAIDEFRAANPQWVVVYETDSNNGLLVLEKKI